jgi:hypothetical protein
MEKHIRGQENEKCSGTEVQGKTKGLFLMRAPGISFEEFKEYCMFREAGIIKDDKERERGG